MIQGKSPDCFKSAPDTVALVSVVLVSVALVSVALVSAVLFCYT